MEGKQRMFNGSLLLSVLRQHGLIIVGFHRQIMAMHASELTRESAGHVGVILFRRSVV